MAEITFSCRASVRLYVIPEVIIGKLQDARKKGKEPSIDGLCEVVAEGFDLIHEGE